MPTGGAIVELTAYYESKLRLGLLLTYDPLGTGGTPIELPSAPGAVASESIALTLLDGVVADSRLATAAVVVVSAAAPRTVTGIQRIGGQLPSATWINASAHAHTFAHESLSATAADRIAAPGSASYVLASGNTMQTAVDASASRTRIAAIRAQSAATADVATVAGAITGLTTDAVVSAFGASTALTTQWITTGKDASDTTGAGSVHLECRSGAATVDGINVYAAAADRHLRRRIGGRAPTARSTSLPASPSTDATAALENIVNSAMVGGNKDLYFDVGASYLLTDQIVIPSSAAGMRWFSGGGSSHSGNAYSFRWGGADDRAMIRVEASDVLIDRATFRVDAVDLLMPVDFDAPPATRFQLKNCVFLYNGAGAGVMQYGFGIGAELGTAEANLEEVRIIDCTWYGCREADIWIRKGQPYAIRIVRPTFHNYRLAGPSGRGVLIDESRCTVEIESAAWGLKAVGVHNRSDAQVTISGMQDCENVKRLYWATLGGNLGKPFVARSGRLVSAGGYGVASTYPTIAADDNAFVVTSGVAPVELHSVNHIAGYQPDWHISVAKETPVSLVNCLLPNSRPVRRNQFSPLSASRQSGGTHIRGCFALASPAELSLAPADVWVQVSDRDGPENPGGSAVLAGSATSVDVGFSPEEWTVPEVHAWEETVSGTPAAGALVVENRTTRGCVIRRTAAPGSGASVRVHWQPRLPRAGRVQQQSAESAFAADTLMATAIGAGPVGTSTNYWWAFAVHRHAITAPVSNKAVCGYRNPGSRQGWVLTQVGSALQFSLNGNNNNYGSVGIGANHTTIMVATYDGTNLRLYGNGALNTTQPVASWTPVPADRMRVGVDALDSWPNDSCTLLSAAFGTGVPSLSQITAHAVECREWGHVRPFSGAGIVTQHRYVFDGDGAALDLIGSAHVTLVSGTAPTPRVVVPSWGV